MNIKEKLKNNQTIKTTYYKYLLVKNAFLSLISKYCIFFFHPSRWKMISAMNSAVRSMYPLNLNLTNKNRFFQGKNVLGYPTMSFLMKDGQKVGWENGEIALGTARLPFMQLSVDREVNFPNLFEKYKPTTIVDFGTASGGTAVFFNQLASKYTAPRILSIDISSADFDRAHDFHEQNKTKEKTEFVFGKSSLLCFDEVKSFLEKRSPEEKVLLSFDDHHAYEHTLQELEIFSPLLVSGDIILMQDTWNQGLYGHEVSPMLAVYEFLATHNDFELDHEFNKALTLPCNFIYGVIKKK